MTKYLSLLLLAGFSTPLYSQSTHLDGLYTLTYKYEPTRWELFEFYSIPFSPVYSTELAVPVSAYLNVAVSCIDKQGNTKVIRVQLARSDYKYPPAIYKINWQQMTDNEYLPTTANISNDENCSVGVTAFSDSLRSHVLFEDRVRVFIWPIWEIVNIDIDLDYIRPLQNLRIVRSALELREDDNSIEKGENITLLAARLKRGYEDMVQDMMALSFRTECPGVSYDRVDFYLASKTESEEKPLEIRRRVPSSKYERCHYVIYLHRSEAEYLLIDHSMSVPGFIELNQLWN